MPTCQVNLFSLQRFLRWFENDKLVVVAIWVIPQFPNSVFPEEKWSDSHRIAWFISKIIKCPFPKRIECPVSHFGPLWQKSSGKTLFGEWFLIAVSCVCREGGVLEKSLWRDSLDQASK